MKHEITIGRFLCCLALFLITASGLTTADQPPAAPTAARLQVVTTLPDYAVITRALGGERVDVAAIVLGDQDAHFIRPKPSFVDLMKKADLLISTGLDLELWLPTVVNKSGNTHVRSGKQGYVAIAQGVKLLEKPVNLSRSEGGVHVYGNPHITCSPLNIATAAGNITTGLITNDPEGREYYQANLEHFRAELNRRLFGEELISLLGVETLANMAANDTLIPFLKQQSYQGRSLDTYHQNWVYFLKLFGLVEGGTIEPKPGIPPSPKHVTELVELMKSRQIGIILAANYFDEQKIRTVARRVGATPVIVPLYVGGVEEVKDYFELVDFWVARLVEANGR